jgi:hypothetical protein
VARKRSIVSTLDEMLRSSTPILDRGKPSCISVKLLVLLVALPGAAFAGGLKDPTAAALDHCLNKDANASTAGEVDCEATAKQAYDHRLNAA